ncbi:hypothetical protein DsansV1_C27g0202891 [Dioscorea sansibarensis]
MLSLEVIRHIMPSLSFFSFCFTVINCAAANKFFGFSQCRFPCVCSIQNLPDSISHLKMLQFRSLAEYFNISQLGKIEVSFFLHIIHRKLKTRNLHINNFFFGWDIEQDKNRKS